MDARTREQRRRNKAQQGRRGELPQFDARGLGRKNKPSATFPTQQCSHIEGGKIRFLRRKRKDGTTYSIPFVKGGVRCPETALAKGRCLEHLA